MDEPGVDISVVVPTLNEAENLPELLRRLGGALAGKNYEVLIVDDNSRDNTPQVCAELSKQYPLRLLVRTQPQNGLSGAVLHGMALARGSIFIVMDADLQHPPEQAPALVAELERGAEFVIGSRYAAGGSTEGGWGFLRKLNSQAATLLARPFSGRTSDPMSGFFALRREIYLRGQRLTPLGYKVGLELMCKCRVRDVREVPIQFANRTRGESKLTLAQQFKYLEHLSRLYDFFFPHASPVAKFLIVTALGWLLGLSLYVGLHAAGVGQISAIAVGYVGMIAVAGLFHARYVRTQREFLATKHPWIEFFLASAVELATCLLAARWFSPRLVYLHSLDLPVLCFLTATGVRYALRKELMQDIRGLRRDLRALDLTSAPPSSTDAPASTPTVPR
jgi:dolichol-phosphate mannosyltransferase